MGKFELVLVGTRSENEMMIEGNLVIRVLGLFRLGTVGLPESGSGCMSISGRGNLNTMG